MRRRRQFTWFPTLGTAGIESSNDNLSGRSFEISVLPNLGNQPLLNTFVIPVVPDAPEDNSDLSQGQGRLVQGLGNEYIIERIVGKIFLAAGLGAATAPAATLVGAGMFVGRANDEQSGGGVDTPVGSASVAELNQNYSPLHEDVIREPWLWRRTWVLGGNATSVTNGGFSFAPLTNAFYGSVQDGPHIDAKSVRRIGNDERLWFAVSTVSIINQGALGTQTTVTGYLDLRVLGALRKARGKSAF